jgi:hypothetical protein
MSNAWDEFSKSVAEESFPRRESLRRLGAAFAGAVLGSVGLKSVWVGPRVDPCKAFCKCGNKSQQSQCLTECRECNSDPRFLCGNCSEGYACADLANDPWNCGACFNVCGDAGPYEYPVCNNGRCEYHCESGADRCNGTCTHLDWDSHNCGACGNDCGEPGPNEYSWCENSQCQFACYEGADYCNGTCTYLGSDPENCGECGHVCGESAPFCSNGVCIAGDEPCPGGLTRCNGICTNLAFDTINCGGCGIVCGGGETCSGGICQSPW